MKHLIIGLAALPAILATTAARRVRAWLILARNLDQSLSASTCARVFPYG
jgi:hypothetical protein